MTDSRFRHCPDCHEIRLLVNDHDGTQRCVDCVVQGRIYQIVQRVEDARRSVAS